MKYSNENLNKTRTRKKNRIKKFILKGGAHRPKNLQDNIQQRVQFLEPKIGSANNLVTYERLVDSTTSSRDRFTRTGREMKLFRSASAEPAGETFPYYNKLHRNMEDIKTPIKDITKYDSVISLLDLRGIVLRNNFKIVPQNTIICFLSPLDVSISANFSDGKLLLEEILKITPEKYKNLFNFRCALRFGALKANKLDGEELPMIYSSCLANSYWYYPGQVYPEMKFQVDYQTFRSDPYTEKFCYISYDRAKNSVSIPTYNRDVITLAELRKNSPKCQDIRLSEIVKCESRDEPFRLVMVFSSRGLEERNLYSQAQLERLMNLELVNYQMTEKYERYVLAGRPAWDMYEFSRHIFDSTCGYVDSEIERLINFNEYSLVSQIDRTYNINYHGMVEKLKEIYEGIDDNIKQMRMGAVSYKYISFCTYSEAKFISGLSPRLILGFLNKLKINRDDIEGRRYQTFFETLEEGLAFSLEKIFHYIQNSAGLVSLLVDPTIQESLFKVCNELALYFQDFNTMLKSPSNYKLKDSIKKIQKSKNYESIVAKNLKETHQTKEGKFIVFVESFDQLVNLKLNPNVGLRLKTSTDITSENPSQINRVGSLYLYSSNPDKNNINGFNPMVELESLTLENFQVNFQLLKPEILPKLKVLELKNISINIHFFRDIRFLGLLGSLTLDNLQNLNDISGLNQLANLQTLTITNMPQLYCIINNPNLETVNLENISGFNLQSIDKLENLQIISLRVMSGSGPYGFPSYFPRKVVNLTMAGFLLIDDTKIVMREGFKVKNLLLSQMRMTQDMFNSLLLPNYLQELKLKKNIFTDGNSLDLTSQSKIKNLIIFNNQFPAVTTELNISTYKYDSVIIKDNINLLDTQYLRANIKGKNKKIVEFLE